MATVSKYLSLHCSDSSLGRYWISTQSIPSGTLLIKESPIASIPNCQIENNNVIDPINKENTNLCWNCCSLFENNNNNNNHYCSTQCKQKSDKILNVILNPSLSFNKSIQNDSTLRLAMFMLLKTINYCKENDKQYLLQDIDKTFDEFQKRPSIFYEIFDDKDKNQRLLQFEINNDMDSNKIYQSYLNKLNEIVPELTIYLNDDNLNDDNLNEENILKLCKKYLNIIFINGFGIRYSLLHDDDMLGLSLYQNTSFFNHSCSPNSFYHFTEGNKIIIRTLREIKKGEMLTISIVEDLECHNKEQRQNMILNHFGFNCLCDRCLNKEYIDNDYLLTQRNNDSDCILNNKQHINLLNYARSNWISSPSNSWKFYERLFNQYQYFYHPFDPDILSLLQEISQKAFIMKDYQIGYDSAELGKQFAHRLSACDILDNCHLIEFRFIFLSFLHYLHLIKTKFPNQQIQSIMNMKSIINDDNNNNNKDGMMYMDDDLLVKMFQNDDNDNNGNNNNDDNKNEEEEEEEEEEDNQQQQQQQQQQQEDKQSKSKNKTSNVKKKKTTKQHHHHQHHNNNNNNKYRKQQHKKSKKSGKQKGNKFKQKNQGNKKKNNSNSNSKKKNNDQKNLNKKDKNVEIYSFGVNDNDKDNNDEYDERMFEMKDCEEDSLEHQLNEKIIDLFATRSILFPKFQDFEQWIGKDLLLMDERLKNVMTSLKDKFDETDIV